VGDTVVTGWRPAPKLAASPFGLYMTRTIRLRAAAGMNGGGGMLDKYEQCGASIRVGSGGGRVSGRSILLEGCVMVGSSFVPMSAWAHKHAS
jgi:hypothetical protein